MSHEISVTPSGLVEAMYANKPAWHGLGEVFDPFGTEAPTSDQVFGKILNWEVRIEPISRKVKEPTSDLGTTYNWKEIPEQFVTVRSDTDQELGIVGKNYHVVQNREAFDFLDSLQSEGLVRYEAAMALRGGRTVVLLARMPSVDVVEDDDLMLRYVMFSTSHDGSAAIQAMPTSVRVVCANTLSVALSKEGHLSYRIKHSKQVKSKLDKARQYLASFDSAFQSFALDARTLNRYYPGLKQTDKYLKALLAVKDDASERVKRNSVKKIDAVKQLIPMDFTWWHLFNAVTEAVDHSDIFVARTAERKFETVIDGKGSELKLKALSLAIQMCSEMM